MSIQADGVKGLAGSSNVCACNQASSGVFDIVESSVIAMMQVL